MATQINSFYRDHAMEYATFSTDGLVVTLPSEKESGLFHDVHCADGRATSCDCKGFEYKHHCKHLTIVQDFLNSKNPRITEVEAGKWYIVNRNTQVWFDAEMQQWFAVGPTENALEIVLAHIEEQQAVKEAEEIVASPVVEEIAEAPDPEKHFWSNSQGCYCYRLMPKEPVAFLSDVKVPAIEAPKFDPNKALFGKQNRAFSII